MKEPNIKNFPLRKLVRLILRDEFSHSIDEETALLIDALLKENPDCTDLCHVQWPHESFDEQLTAPKLWIYRHWAESSERHERGKKRAEKERIEKFIFDKNIERVKRKILRYFYCDEVTAISLAIFLLRNNREMAFRELGVTLITNIDEV